MIKPLTPKSIEYADTCNGKLRGFKQRDIYHFLGIQYGECKRWQTATPVQPWKGIKNAVQFGNRAFPANGFTPWDSCGVAHEAFPYSEDCLNLNVWTTSLDKEAKKPVKWPGENKGSIGLHSLQIKVMKSIQFSYPKIRES